MIGTALAGTAETLIFPRSTNVGSASRDYTRYVKEITVEPRLNNTNFHASATQVAWWLYGNPKQVDTCEVAFVNGRQTPVIEQYNDAPNRLALTYLCYLDFGVAPVGYRGIYKVKGSA
jgi:hypothetical protein